MIEGREWTAFVREAKGEHTMVSVGIVGGSGYMGGEALRVLLRHPHADVAWATSRSPGPIEQVHPNLYDTGRHFVRLEDVKTPDFVLLALPTGTAIVALQAVSMGECRRRDQLLL